jgi:hypothetical protein
MFPEAVRASINLLPHLFHRCRRCVPDLRLFKFRRIGWQSFDTDLPIRRQILLYNPRAMGLRSVPIHYQWLPEAGPQVAQHSHYLWPANRLAVMTLINPSVHRQRRDCRELLPLALTPQDRWSAAWGPSTREARLETAARFVHENDHCLAPPGFF